MSTISHTGPDSYNKVKNRVSSYVKVENNNNLTARNYNDQSAWSGDARVTHNTYGGDATTGDATNRNSFSASATVKNSGGNWGGLGNVGGGGNANTTIEYTGPDSYNKVDNSTKSTVKIENNNDLRVVNNNTQTASTGDARVSDNTRGGDATTGDATNTNSTRVEFNVTN
jgi:hypothetical protein